MKPRNRRKRGESDIVAFTRRFRVDPITGCWLWTGSIMKNGYGNFTATEGGTKGWLPHRWSWMYHRRQPIPDGMNVCHNCPSGDNPRCVNPDHLFLGSTSDNVHDCYRKGRNHNSGAPGETNARAKLTAEDVRAIRALNPRTAAEMRHVSSVVGISVSGVRKIVYRESWKHLS